MYVHKKQRRREVANMARAFIFMARHGDVDTHLAEHLYRAINQLDPPDTLNGVAEWAGDLHGSGYELDKPLTSTAHEALGPVYRVLSDGAGGRWLHDTRTITEFRRMGHDAPTAAAYIEALRTRHPTLKQEIEATVAVKGPVVTLPTASELGIGGAP